MGLKGFSAHPSDERKPKSNYNFLVLEMLTQ